MYVSFGFAKDPEIWIVTCKLRDSAKREKRQNYKVVK